MCQYCKVMKQIYLNVSFLESITATSKKKKVSRNKIVGFLFALFTSLGRQPNSIDCGYKQQK